MEVMVRVTLEVDEDQVAQQVIGIPRVLVRHMLVTTVREHASAQSVVFNEIDAFEDCCSDETLKEEVDYACGAEDGVEGICPDRAQCVPPDQLVFPAQSTKSLSRKESPLKRKGFAYVEEDCLRNKTIDRFATPCRGGIIRRPDGDMVAPDVLDLIAGIQHGGQE